MVDDNDDDPDHGQGDGHDDGEEQVQCSSGAGPDRGLAEPPSCQHESSGLPSHTYKPPPPLSIPLESLQASTSYSSPGCQNFVQLSIVARRERHNWKGEEASLK